MKTKLFTPIILTIAVLTLFHLATATAFAQEAPATKTARLLKESGVKYTKAADVVWSVPYEGKNGNFNVVVFTTPEILAMFAVIVEKKDLKLTPELMKQLLILNGEFDRVKIAIDKDGDLIARIDLGIRLLDKQELKVNLDQTAGATGDVLAAIKPFLGATK